MQTILNQSAVSQATAPTVQQISQRQAEGKIILLKGKSQYDVVRIFIDDLAKGFTEMGYDTIVIDLLENNFIQDISQIKGKIRCFFSFNGMGTGVEVEQLPLYDYLGVPLVSWFIDHPYYVQNVIKYPMERWVVMVSNENNYRFYCNEYKKPKTISKCVQIAGSQHVANILPIEERPYDLVFFGTNLGAEIPKPEEIFNFLNKRLHEIVWATIEAGKFETERELYELFYDHIIESGIDPQDLSQDSVMSIISSVDDYLRAFRRDYVLRSLKDFPITIFGKGWDGYKDTHPNFTIHNQITFPEVIEVMGKSKLVLNVMPNNRTGIHDRLAYAMHQGTACLSESTPGLKKDFQHNESLYFFDLKPNLMDTMHQQVSGILQNPADVQRVANIGMQTVQKHFNWRDRAAEILKLADNHELLMALK